MARAALSRACPAIGGMFIYSGISLRVSRCRPKLSFQTKWRNRGRRSSGQKLCPHFKESAGRSGSGPRDRNLPQGQISETTQMFLPRPAR